MDSEQRLRESLEWSEHLDSGIRSTSCSARQVQAEAASIWKIIRVLNLKFTLLSRNVFLNHKVIGQDDLFREVIFINKMFISKFKII